MRRRALLLAALVVIGLLVGWALRGSTGTRSPGVLHLAATAVPRADAALAASPVTGSGYQLVGPLPTGTPDTPAYSVRSAARATTVARLADALDAGTPHPDGAGWRSDKGLAVNPDGSWWWSRCAGGVASSDGVVAGCATTATAAPATGSGGAVSPPAAAPSPAPTPDQETLLSTAGPVFAAVGLDVGNARVEGSVAVVDPEVGGLPTYGLSTRVAVTADGQVSDASGWLVATARGDSYPIRTARAAFDALPPVPRPLLLCSVGPSGKGCPEPSPVKVTGARRGLALQGLRDGGHVLAPAWLFAVAGSPEPVPGLAVAPRYVETGPGPAPSGVPGSAPGTPAPPPSALPPEPARS